ncbi:MAG: diguanylate cyclase, partial [Nitrospirae bacterium]
LGALREDFYYRIRVFEITLPPLRKRREDIPLLVQHFVTEGSRIHQRPVKDIAKDALHCLMSYPWPGNVRELKNAIDHAFVTMSGDFLTLLDLPPEIRHPFSSSLQQPSRSHLGGQEERQRILDALTQANGNRTYAAQLLGISRVSLWKKMRKYHFLPEP